jgi:hypothetical protein
MWLSGATGGSKPGQMCRVTGVWSPLPPHAASGFIEPFAPLAGACISAIERCPALPWVAVPEPPWSPGKGSILPRSHALGVVNADAGPAAAPKLARPGRTAALTAGTGSRCYWSSSFVPPPHAATAATKGLSMLSTSRTTWVILHCPPRAAGIPRSLSPSAIACNVTAPLACSSFTIGAMSAARARARACKTALPMARCLAVSLAP